MIGGAGCFIHYIYAKYRQLVARLMMKRSMRIFLFLILTTILVGCGAFPYELTITKKAAETEDFTAVEDTATLMVENTATAVRTSSLTPVFTSTLAASSTPIPTRTSISTRTSTLTATITRTPTRTIYYCPQAAIGTPCP